MTLCIADEPFASNCSRWELTDYALDENIGVSARAAL